MSQILIQNLDFTYDGDHTPVFERLNLQWDTDWKLGLVGRNGRGKTTLLRLLEGSLEEGDPDPAGAAPLCAKARPGPTAARPGRADGRSAGGGRVDAPAGAEQAGAGGGAAGPAL